MMVGRENMKIPAERLSPTSCLCMSKSRKSQSSDTLSVLLCDYHSMK